MTAGMSEANHESTDGLCQSDADGVLLSLGKAQIDALFKMQMDAFQMDDSIEMLDDSVFVPLVEIILGTFESAGLDAAGVERLWDYAYSAYDSACRGAEPDSPFAENKRLMQSFLLGGPRRVAPRRKKRRTQRP